MKGSESRAIMKGSERRAIMKGLQQRAIMIVCQQSNQTTRIAEPSLDVEQRTLIPIRGTTHRKQQHCNTTNINQS